MPSVLSKKETMRKHIIVAAIRVLNDKEYHECLIDIIAKKAGIGKGTVYLYFKSKQELYYSILFELVHEARRIAGAAIKGSSTPPEQLRMLLEQLNGFIDSHGNAFIIARAEAGNFKGKMLVLSTQLYGGLLEQIGKIFEDGVTKKIFNTYPPTFMGALIMSSLLTAAKYRQMNRPGARAVTPALLAEIYMNGICTKNKRSQ